MITYDVSQGSEAWSRLHIGRPSASQFDRIVTADGGMKLNRAKTDWSDATYTYMRELLVGYFLGVPAESFSSGFMQRGLDLEAQARAWYEFDRNVDVDQIGFITTDDGRIGCSPDGLIGSAGMLQVKCLSAKEHLDVFLNGCTEYDIQVQGELLVAEREWSDLLFWHPTFPKLVVQHRMDKTIAENMFKTIGEFVGCMDAVKDRLIAQGFEPYKPRTIPAGEFAEFDRIVKETTA
jgi:hypothetical protein